MAREGSLGAPTRHPIAWRDEAFYDRAALEKETRRVFDICHGCRRCFNLCDSFPRLFDLIDETESGELDGVASADFTRVVDACTLCDMCFMTKCPYVPPHEFNIDFPHLMLRHRAVELREGKRAWSERQLTRTDRNGKLAALAPGLVNWASSTGNRVTRPVLERVAGVDARAALPRFFGPTFTARAKAEAPPVNPDAPAFGRKAALFATCFVNYNGPDIGLLTRRVLARSGVETEVVYPGCCGMPQFEQGDIAAVAKAAKRTAAALKPTVEAGHAIVALIPSCALMMKFEWPLILPDDEDVKALAAATRDVSEYIVDIAENEGLAAPLAPIEGGVALHIACHARAQNMGRKAEALLKLIPDTKIEVIERCSGHGGSWGIMKAHFDTALKIGRPVAKRAAASGLAHVASECPLAAEHIRQGMALGGEAKDAPQRAYHPVELFARAYGVAGGL